MAYFPNGFSHMDYDEQYCSRCVHQPIDPFNGGCTVTLLHTLYNYELCNEKEHPGKVMLDTLIPPTPDGLGAEQCTMFHERTEEEREFEIRAERDREKYAAALAEMRRAA